ncbi:MAG: trypsin-like peptidase domain-containing protein [Syntrophus sp. (in: bacteria)]
MKKNSDDNVKTAATPSEFSMNNFKPWMLALALMVLITIGWTVYEAVTNEGGVFGRFFTKALNRNPKVGYGVQVALNTAVPGAAKELQTSYHNIIDDTRPAVISIDAVIQGQSANPGDPAANFARIGSGVIIDPRGYVLSSLHVVEGSSSLKATVYGQTGALEYPLKIVKSDRTSDLSLLRIQGDGPFPYAGLGDSNSVRTGDVVISIGSPFGFEQSVTSGIVSSRNRNLNVGGMVYENLIQTDSSINKGSSGGPLINAKGDVIGINTAIYSSSGTFVGISFAVPINRSLDLLGGVIDLQNVPPPVAKGQLAALSKTGKQIGNSYRFPDGQTLSPPHSYRGTCADWHPQFLTPGFDPNNYGMGRGSVLPAAPGQGPNQVWGQGRNLGPGCQPAPSQALNQVWGQRGCAVAGPNNVSLGMTVTDVDDVIAGQNKMMRPSGVFVTSVTPGMPADAAGMQRGDVITRVDGRKIQDSNSFSTILGAKNGSTMDFVILRFGVRRTVQVKMAPGGAAQAVAGTAIKPTEFTWLGAEIIPLPPGTGNAGVYVAESLGLFGNAGVKQGDVITGMNNKPVTDIYSFISLSKKADSKKGILLDVIRSGYPLFITIKDNLAQNQITPTPLAQRAAL